MGLPEGMIRWTRTLREGRFKLRGHLLLSQSMDRSNRGRPSHSGGDPRPNERWMEAESELWKMCCASGCPMMLQPVLSDSRLVPWAGLEGSSPHEGKPGLLAYS